MSEGYFEVSRVEFGFNQFCVLCIEFQMKFSLAKFASLILC